MLNKIVIVGRMTKDAKIYDNEEVKIATFSVATERNYKDENDEIACDYIFCKAFGKMASNIEKYTSQGSLVGITGQIVLVNMKRKNKLTLSQNYMLKQLNLCP